MNRIFTLTLLLCLSMSTASLAQLYYGEDFEKGLDKWDNYDLDGDSEKWVTYNFVSVIPFFGEKTLISFSRDFEEKERDPDHLLVSPLIDLTGVTADKVILRYDAIAGYTANENYQVYITESNKPEEILKQTPIIQEETTPEFVKEFDMKPYVGKKFYLSFRHYNSKGQGYIGIDNVEIKTPQDNYAAITNVVNSSYLKLNQEEKAVVIVQNNGTNKITKLKVSWSSGDRSESQEFNVNIDPGRPGEVTLDSPIKFDKVDKNIVKISIDEVNGQKNNNVKDSARELVMWSISQSGDRMVLVEKSTGTWCGFCPRGFVALEKLDAELSDKVAAVAVHVRDTMTIGEYAVKSEFAGAPLMNVDRSAKNVNVDLDNIIELMNSFLAAPCAADMTMSSTISGNNLKLDLSSTFYTKYDKGDLRYGVILYENGVTGKGSAYDQANYFSGQNVKMDGYENRPNPIPADSMVYDHVARVLLGGYDGQEGSIPSAIEDKQSASYTFNYTFPEDAKIENFVAIGVIIDAGGEIVNSSKVKLATQTSVEETRGSVASFSMFPNPATDVVSVTDLEAGDYTLQIHDMVGRVLQSQSYTVSNNRSGIEHNIEALESGKYVLSIVAEGQSISKILTVE